MNYPSHYTSFLGGEVSPLFWHRCDMEKFSRWLATAENIRFHNVGAFYNRTGFERMGPTLNSLESPIVKLIPFIFNNNEVFEIEFTNGKFRVRKDGKVVIREDGSEVSYDSPIKIKDIQQLKYAQSGDIIFIASATSPIMELRRLKEDGTEWELAPFDSKIMPLGDVNDIKEKTIKLSKITDADEGSPSGSFTFQDPLYGYDVVNYASYPKFKEIKFDLVLEDDTTYTASYSGRMDQITSHLYNNTDFSKYLTFSSSVDGDYNSTLSFSTKAGQEGKIRSFQASASIPDIKELVVVPIMYGEYSDAITEYEYRIPEIEDKEFIPCRYELKYSVFAGTNTASCGSKTSPKGSYEEAAELFSHGGRVISSTYEEGNPNYIKLMMSYFSSVSDHIELKVTYRKESQKHFTHNFFDDIPKDAKTYRYDVGENIGLKKNDVFCIKNKINSGEIIVTKDKVTGWESETVFGNGRWRYYTSGNWKGEIRVQYSEDSGTTWNTFRTTVSSSKEAPGIFNENVSGEIETDNDTLLFKVVADVNDGSVNINFITETFYTNSYYKVIYILSNTSGYVECIKNDVGEVADTYKWRKSAFSDELGHPETIGFYQNRLFIGKGYELWGSKINDFWDFYEPIELSKDDPVNISLLSYRVNDIKSILTARSFFVFTTGGEFGITSEGAISQDDKFLKQFSSHGINDCSPLLVGNIVIFVDSSGNTVRAFQYSFENDTYEANDMSVFIEEKLKGKQIITTEYMKNNKECLFLDSDGIVWVFKFFPEQNIMAWSHWKHSKYKITNLCVSPHGAYENLFIVVSTPNGKFIEKLNDTLYADSVHTFNSEESLTEVKTSFLEGDEVVVNDGERKYKQTVGKDGVVALLNPAKSVSVGIPYISEATLLSPVISTKDVGYTTYNRKKPFKAHFCFSNSYGFKVGIKEEEKMSVDFHLPSDPIDNATTLTSGKKSVLIPSKYDGSAMVSFVQEEPYPMQIENIMLEVDYAGK